MVPMESAIERFHCRANHLCISFVADLLDNDNVRFQKLEDVLGELQKENRDLKAEMNKFNSDKTPNDELQGQMMKNLSETIKNISTKYVSMEVGLLKNLTNDVEELKRETTEQLMQDTRKFEKIDGKLVSLESMLSNLTAEVGLINKTLKIVRMVN